jgi:serine/threonine protein phosphatase PrpC
MIWKPRELDLQTAHAKMVKNGRKALEAAIIRAEDLSSCATIDEATPPTFEEIQKKMADRPLEFSFSILTTQGNRSSANEDAALCIETPQGLFTAVADGHGISNTNGPGGKQVADQIINAIKMAFPKYLEDFKGHVHQAMERFIYDLSQNHPEWYTCGSTLVFSFITKTGVVYTATIGDSKAHAYRMVGDNLKAIALSCVRGWNSPKDAARAAIGSQISVIATEWPKYPQTKFLRFAGINISRSLGDLWLAPVISSKPKITVQALQAGDTVVLGSDGFWDYVPQEEAVTQITASRADLATHLVDYAVRVRSSEDHVTVVAIYIKKAQENPS